MEKMQAIVVYGPGDFRHEEVEKPVVGPGDVLLKIEATGICGSDLHVYRGGDPWTARAKAANKDFKFRPNVRGHEYCGTVVEMGKGAAEATGLKIGDKATAELGIPCRKCFYCVRGLYHLCINMVGFLGSSWAQYMKCPEGSIMWRVPERIPAKEAALIEPLACSAHGVERARIGPEDTVVVSGLGTIGMGMLQMARLRHPYRLIGLDIDENLCAIAKELGADYAFNPKTMDVREAIMELTGGIGCCAFLETSGATSSLELAFEVLRKRGRLMVYAAYHDSASLNFTMVGEFKELEIIGGHWGPFKYPSVIQFLERGLVNAKRMITDEFPFSRIKEAMEVKGKPGHTAIKTLLIPE
ncbi:MAG: alcohol dehydrogenase catalytic domain-containing protein [Spirochaetales bacterium]|nr:alcohol dehydrogenase catalytic domain-containing protein [Spirochaetales bacterium]